MNTREQHLPIDRNEADRSEARSRVLSFEAPHEFALSIRAGALVFEDSKSKALLERAERVAASDANVLIQGATGTGKELLARHVHNCSLRRDKVFVPVNCAAITETLIESELFGHERGAFTGAVGERKGWFEAANGGTLFLDEIGDLPLSQQVKLLRVLQEREVVRLGSHRATPVDVRLIAATNIDLEEAVAAGRFREDLFYRLRVALLYLPALRERPGDILPLALHFLSYYGHRLGIENIRLSPEAALALERYAWPGNIRELENVVHQALLVCSPPVLEPADFSFSPARTASHAMQPADGLQSGLDALREALTACFDASPRQDGIALDDRIQEAIIHGAHAYCGQNQSETARMLGISRNIVRGRLLRYGLITQ